MDRNLKAMMDRRATHSSMRELLDDDRAASPRTAAEEECSTHLPGDPVDGRFNKYLTLASTRPLQVKRLIESGALCPEDEQEARAALAIYSGLTGQRVWGQRR